jgi:hypothetical protein
MHWTEWGQRACKYFRIEVTGADWGHIGIENKSVRG